MGEVVRVGRTPLVEGLIRNKFLTELEDHPDRKAKGRTKKPDTDKAAENPDPLPQGPADGDTEEAPAEPEPE
jgi:hypothetical protein